MLVLALVMATVFVVMSAWQFGESRSEDEIVSTEELNTPVELTEVYEPQRNMTIYEADRIVDIDGEIVAGTQTLIDSRLHDGREGYWAVAAMRVDGAPDGEVIPVVLGWTDSPDWAVETGASLDGPARYQEEEWHAAAPEVHGVADFSVQGRLLPPEAPSPDSREDMPPRGLPTLSTAELINLWDEDSYSGFVVAFDMEAGGAPLEHDALELEQVWVDTQPEASSINWLNLFYAVEWTLFAGFAFFMWWRLVKDAHLRRLEEERLDREWEEQWRAEQLAELQASGTLNAKDSDDR